MIPTTELYTHAQKPRAALVYRRGASGHVVTMMGKDGTARYPVEDEHAAASLFGVLRLKLVVDGYRNADEVRMA